MTRAVMEARRLKACEDIARGVRQSIIARRYKVSRTTASRWAKEFSAGGVSALRATKGTGRPPAVPRRVIRDVYLAGGKGGGWTTAAVAEAVRDRTGVWYDEDHIGRTLRLMGLHGPGRGRKVTGPVEVTR